MAVDQKIHAKMVIVDNRMVYNGSANLTITGLSNHGEAGTYSSEPNYVTDCLSDYLSAFHEARITMFMRGTDDRNTT